MSFRSDRDHGSRHASELSFEALADMKTMQIFRWYMEDILHAHGIKYFEFWEAPNVLGFYLCFPAGRHKWTLWYYGSEIWGNDRLPWKGLESLSKDIGLVVRYSSNKKMPIWC